ncbi:uncharacterized protein NESG_00190 [Nematocida ausubeli]|uniref:Rho-GAP domain-containing protein n=1 Tax=Nematocida ausubeli (strain ATCC PRA-371 / ERTm2) TaxID=1913371 RepID=A0A086J4P7_NEMA1|nr:uncharacterized protein NESG_00190 [Nematocida ausubeli]KFG27115.1 hypothetical protein NESG_00190 [Nematocida ausubeli]
MAEERQAEQHTINSLSYKELEEYKENMKMQNQQICIEVFTVQIFNEMVSEVEPESISVVKKVSSALYRVIQIAVKLIQGIKPSRKSSMDLVNTQYKFCSQNLQVTADIEALMQVIGVIDIARYPELFRQSASAREVKVLCRNLSSITFPKMSPSSEKCPEEKEKKNLEMIRIIAYNFKEFDIEAIASVYKMLLKTKNPLFPTKYICEYIKIGKLSCKKTKIVLCQFILAFVICKQKQELFESTCSFLYSLITKENSKLRFANISVVFTPIFFIDEDCQIVDSNFKEIMENLKNFLEFFLENSPQIFILALKPKRE